MTAIEELAEPRTRSYVRSVLKKFVRAQDIDDVFQDSMLIAIRNLHRYKEGNFRAWVATIARWQAHNRRRVESRRQRGRILYSDEAYDHVPTLYEHEPDDGFSQEIQWVLDDLDPDDRFLILSVAQGHEYQECADEMHIPLGTVMSRVFRIRQYFKQRLGER